MAEPCWNHAGETTKSLLRLWAAICEVQGTALFFDWSRYAKISHSSFGPQVPWRSQINCRKSGRFRICAYINHISIHIYIYTHILTILTLLCTLRSDIAWDNPCYVQRLARQTWIQCETCAKAGVAVAKQPPADQNTHEQCSKPLLVDD